MLKKVLIVDDHSIVRKGLRMLVSRNAGLRVCGEAENAESALESIDVLAPDLVITDISLPGMGGIEFIKHIQVRWPKLPVLVVSRHDEILYAERAIRAGARGYIMKQATDKAMVEAIQTVLHGRIYASKPVKEKIMFKLTGLNKMDSPLEQLSDRELEVFQLIGRGCGTRQIAEMLHLSVKTVESYRARIKDKLNLSDATELVLHAVKWAQEEN